MTVVAVSEGCIGEGAAHEYDQTVGGGRIGASAAREDINAAGEGRVGAAHEGCHTAGEGRVGATSYGCDGAAAEGGVADAGDALGDAVGKGRVGSAAAERGNGIFICTVVDAPNAPR